MHRAITSNIPKAIVPSLAFQCSKSIQSCRYWRGDYSCLWAAGQTDRLSGVTALWLPSFKDTTNNLSSLLSRLSWPTATVNTKSHLHGWKIKYLIKISGCWFVELGHKVKIELHDIQFYVLRNRGRRGEGGCHISQKKQGSHISAENQDGGYDSATSKTRGKPSLGRLSSLEQPLQEWGSMQPNQGVKSLQPPNAPFWDVASASSDRAVKPCQRQSLGVVCSSGWLQQGMSVGWFRNFSVSRNNLNYHLSPGSSHLGNLTEGSGGRCISLPTPFLQGLSLVKRPGQPIPLGRVLEGAGVCSGNIACSETSDKFYRL